MDLPAVRRMTPFQVHRVLFLRARLLDARYWLAVFRRPSEARGFQGRANATWRDLERLGWRPTRGCLEYRR